MTLNRAPAFLVAIVFLLAACGGSTAAPTGGATRGAEATMAATEAGGATSPTETGMTGGTITDWCLNTVAEVSAALEIEIKTSQGAETPGLGGGCTYTDASGSMGYAISIITVGDGQATLDAARQGADAETIDGIGDDAVLITPQGPLAFNKGSITVSLGATPNVPIVQDAAAYRAAHVSLAQAAAARLP